jgi:4a-hydroxytetrahydrobiopterin dehydratase
MMGLLTVDEIDRRLAERPGWSRVGPAIARQYVFDGFPAAVAFVARLVPGAEAADHHPDVTISYRRVTVSYTTHSEGGITEKDFAGAAEADRQA